MAGGKILRARGSFLHRRTRHAWQAALIAIAGLGVPGAVAPPRPAQPFTVHEVASFSTPWAMDFLPGSGVRLTKMALLTEKEGRLWLVDTATGQRRR